jgi:ABC-type transport system substrate-binding protein
MMMSATWVAVGVAILVAATAAAAPPEEEAGKRGGTLTYTIPADAPPSFDGHREGTFATLHAMAPFYSVLIRVNPENPSSTTDFVCDLCTAMPQPTDDGKTYTFKIRDGVKFHDGSPLTAADVAASWEHIIHPPQGVLSPRQSWYTMVDMIEAPDPTTVVFRLKFATSAFIPALADPFTFIYKKTATTEGGRPRASSARLRGAGRNSAHVCLFLAPIGSMPTIGMGQCSKFACTRQHPFEGATGKGVRNDLPHYTSIQNRCEDHRLV